MNAYTFCQVKNKMKGTLKETKRKGTNPEKIFAIHVSDKDSCTSRKRKELYSLMIRPITNQNMCKITALPKKMFEWRCLKIFNIFIH